MNAKKLEGVWYESTEESEGDRVVYRTAQYEFPRTRAPRPSLEFGKDGKVAFGQPGPADARARATGTWQVRGETLIVTASKRREAYVIESVGAEKLVLRRKENANGDP